MLQVTSNFRKTVYTLRGDAHAMLSAGMIELSRHIEGFYEDHRGHDARVKCAGDIGILAGRFSDDPDSFIRFFESDILNG